MSEEKRDMPKAVLDTNVLLSALHWYLGNPRQILEKAVRGEIVLFWCKEMLEELKEVIIRDFDETDEQIYTRLSFILTYTELVEITHNDKVIKEDPDDDIIINCALSTNADYIVSGDAHLLKLKEYKGIKIVSPAEFINLFE